MGRRGPARQPPALALLKGETRPSRARPGSPVPPNPDPVMPEDLSAEAQAVWRRVLADQAPGVIRAIDSDALRMYCEAVVDYLEARRMLARSSPLVKGQKGNLVRNPLAIIVKDSREAIKVWARELGLSPAARAGLTAPADAPKDDIQDRFFRPRAVE